MCLFVPPVGVVPILPTNEGASNPALSSTSSGNDEDEDDEVEVEDDDDAEEEDPDVEEAAPDGMMEPL